MHATTDGTFQLCAKSDIPTLTQHALQVPRIFKITPTRTNGRVNPKLFPMTRLSRWRQKRSSDVQTFRRVFRSRCTRAERR